MPAGPWLRRLRMGVVFSLPVLLTLAALYACFVEPTWLAIRTVRIGPDTDGPRILHITDLHHKGERAWLERVVRECNALQPAAVCFTGDLVEEAAHLAEALEILQGLQAPLVGVPGNHERWAGIRAHAIEDAFAATGGAWLEDATWRIPGTGVLCIGLTGERSDAALDRRTADAPFRLVLMHYPGMADEVGGRYDLLLAGHTHGGQIRVPLIGALILPFRSGHYDRGLFDSPAGPLYVNPGIGWFSIRARFACRPEITVFDLPAPARAVEETGIDGDGDGGANETAPAGRPAAGGEVRP